MAEERDLIKFLTEHGEATIEEISIALNMPKYGPNSVYAILYSLKSRNIVERRGSRWALVEHETIPVEATKPAVIETSPSIEKVEKETKAVSETVISRGAQSEGVTAAIEAKAEVTEARYIKPDRLHGTQKSLSSVKTGTLLDTLFYGFDDKPLDGIPASGQFMVIGPLGAGKSLLVSEIALKAASFGHRVLYVTFNDVWVSESQMFDLQSRMKVRASSLRLDWDDIIGNLLVLNPHEVNEEFLEEYNRIITSEEVELAVLDPLNSLEKLGEIKGGAQIPTDILNVNRSHDVTGFFTLHTGLGLNETKRPSTLDQFAYPMDCVISLLPAHLMASGIEVSVRGIEQIRILRIISCRLCSFESRGILVNITRNGLIQPISL